MTLDSWQHPKCENLGKWFSNFFCERFTGELLRSTVPFLCTSGMGQVPTLKKKKKYPGSLLWKIL